MGSDGDHRVVVRSQIWRPVLTHVLAGGAGVALWHAAELGSIPSRIQSVPEIAPGSIQSTRETAEHRSRQWVQAALEKAAKEQELWNARRDRSHGRSPRERANDALARRGEILAAHQAEADALKAAAAEFAGDSQLLEKIQDQLYEGGEGQLAAMMLALFLRDEEAAFDELRQREALLSIFDDLKVLEALPKESLERWTTREDLPPGLAASIFECLGKRLGREGDLEGMARTWRHAADRDYSFVSDFVGEWICTDPEVAVRLVFHEWPAALRDDFLDALPSVFQVRSIWTTGLAAEFRNADWEQVPVDMRDKILDQIASADDLPTGQGDFNPTGAIPAGLDHDEARKYLSDQMEQLLEDGIDSYDQLADGRTSVEAVSRRLASRVAGSELYPEAWAETLFEELAVIDPAAALRFAEHKVDPARLQELAGEVIRQLAYSEPRADRILEAFLLLPAPVSDYSISLLGGYFLDWWRVAPEEANGSLSRLPATHPLRKLIEDRLAGKKEEDP